MNDQLRLVHQLVEQLAGEDRQIVLEALATTTVCAAATSGISHDDTMQALEAAWQRCCGPRRTP